MQLVENPKSKHLSQIKSWLEDEYRYHNEGFYCNWDTIVDCYKKKRLFCLIDNDFAIGFVIWLKRIKTVYIDIFEVKREFRGQGNGRFMIDKISEFFLLEGFLALDLQCSPTDSESFWKNMGFITYDDGWKSSNQRMYKCLIKTLPFANFIKGSKSFPYIELWDCEPFLTNDNEPRWKWIIKFEDDSNKLVDPIFFPCNDNWKISYRNGDISIAKKVKYFSDNEIHIDGFLIIKELKNKHCP